MKRILTALVSAWCVCAFADADADLRTAQARERAGQKAEAVAEYIRRQNPERVSLICMGQEGREPAEEDELCALYLESLLTGREMPDIDEKLQALRTGGGRRFFDPALRDVFPEEDFRMCIERNRFDFVIRIEKDGEGQVSRKVPGMRPDK